MVSKKSFWLLAIAKTRRTAKEYLLPHLSWTTLQLINSLTELDLSHTDIGDRGLKEVAIGLQRNSGRQDLRLLAMQGQRMFPRRYFDAILFRSFP